MSEREWGFEDEASGWRWAARGLFLLAVPGWLEGANGGWGVWAGIWLMAAGAVGVLAPRSSTRSAVMTRVVGRPLTNVLNRIGAVGFVGLGIFALIHGLVT